jgi:peroxiredoxin
MQNLDIRLAKIRDWAAKNLQPADNAVMENHIEFLRKGGALDRVLKAGAKAPEFQLKNQKGELISSTELLKKGPLVVSFYRGSWCPYCAEEVKVLNDGYEEFKAAGAEVVVISPQGFSRTQKQAAEIHLKYNLLVDEENRVAKMFGLAYSFPDDLKNIYLNTFHNDIQAVNEASTWELPIPARFVIDTNGIIRDARVDPDYRYRPEPSETLDFLKKLEGH